MSVNKAILLGKLGKDPELKTTTTGKKVCNFSIATSKKVNGEEKTTWHNIVTWNKTADLCAGYLKKGSQAYVEGEIQTRSYDDNQGNKKYVTEIVAYSVQFIGGSKHTADSGMGGGTPSSPPYSGNEFEGDDIPF